VLVLALCFVGLSVGGHFDLFPLGENDPSFWQNNMFTPTHHVIDLSEENWEDMFVEFGFVSPVIHHYGCSYVFRTNTGFAKQGSISVNNYDDTNTWKTSMKVIFAPDDIPAGTEELTLTTNCAINRYAAVFPPSGEDGASVIIDLRKVSLPDHPYLLNAFPVYDGGAGTWAATDPLSRLFYHGPGHGDTNEDVDTFTDSLGYSQEIFWNGFAMLDLADFFETYPMERPVLEIQWYKDVDDSTEMKIYACPASVDTDCDRPSQFDELISAYDLEDEDYESAYGLLFAPLDRLLDDGFDARILIHANDESEMGVFPYVRIWDAANLDTDPVLFDLRWEDDFLGAEFFNLLDVEVHPDCASTTDATDTDQEFMQTGHVINCEWRVSAGETTCTLEATGIEFDREEGVLFVEAEWPSAWRTKQHPVIEFWVSTNEPGSVDGTPILCPIAADGPVTATKTSIESQIDMMTAFTLSVGGRTYYRTPEWARMMMDDDVPLTHGWQVSVPPVGGQFANNARLRLQAFPDPDASSIIMHSFVKVFEGTEPCSTLPSCQNGGTCVPGFSNTRTCECPEGYSGDVCEIEDPCMDVDCENDGRCMDGICYCAGSHFGENCEISLADTFAEMQSLIDALKEDVNATNTEIDEIWEELSSGSALHAAFALVLAVFVLLM